MATQLTRRPFGIGNMFVDPFRNLESGWDQLMNRWFESQADSGLGAYPVDIDEDEQHIYVEAELPGFKKDEISVDFESGVLTISAERKSGTEEKAEQKRTRHLSERRFTRVQRSFSLPQNVDEQNVDAKLEEGVLKVTLDKRPETQRRRIEVK